MHYKLDLGIDHVLIDEAQDTSPKQWEIVQALVAEFSPAPARATVDAHDLRGRRREAVDLLVPGRGAARVRRRCASTSSGLHERPSWSSRDVKFKLFVPLGAEIVLEAVDTVFRPPAGLSPG